MAKPDLNMILGRYVGFSPSDSSNSGFGEIDMIVAPEGVTTRFATGYEIQEDIIPMSELDLVDTEDTFKKFPTQEGLETKFSLGNIAGEFRYRNGNMAMIFLRESLEGAADSVLILGSPADMLGPTILYSQAMADSGLLNDFIEKLESAYGKDTFPRLRYGGRTKIKADEEG